MIATAGRRERKKNETREAIIRAALDLFEEKGYDATTIDDIAEAVDISGRTFFRYFESKLDVIVANKEHGHPSLAELVAGRPDDEDPVTAFHAAIREEMQGELATNELVARQFRLMLSTPALRWVALEHFHEHQDELVHIFARRLGSDEHDLRPRVMAAAAAGATWTAVERWATNRLPVDALVPMIDEAFALLRRGFAP